MRPLFLLALVAGCGGGCTPAPAPPPAPVSDDGGGTAPSVVLAELVAAGCVSPTDDGGLEAITLAHNSVDQPTWLGCLFDGGTVASCHVPPCSSSTVHTLRKTP